MPAAFGYPGGQRHQHLRGGDTARAKIETDAGHPGGGKAVQLRVTNGIRDHSFAARNRAKGL